MAVTMLVDIEDQEWPLESTGSEGLAALVSKATFNDTKSASLITVVELTNEESPKPVISLKSGKDCQRNPSPRLERRPITNPAFNDLLDLALLRVVDIFAECKTDPPPRLFPNSEHIRHTFFPGNVWDQHGDMETEYGRISFMLDRYPERGISFHQSTTIQALLSNPHPLQNWYDAVESLAEQAQVAKEEVSKALFSHNSRRATCYRGKIDFLWAPIGYETDVQASLNLWEAALCCIASDLQAGKTHNVGSFVHIHAFIKDPIGGLRAPLPQQTTIFLELWSCAQAILAGQSQTPLVQEFYKKIAAQLALESSFLSVSKLQRISHIHFLHHQELCYVYTTIDHLPRAEFSIPTRVLEILSEIVLGASELDVCMIAPITIAYAPPIHESEKPFKVIIDGNNRVTALVLLRFLATQTNLEDMDLDALDAYCAARGLGSKWLIDVRDVLATLLDTKPTLDLLRKHLITIRKFLKVSRVPALVVQESSFFTLCLRRGTNEEPVLLQPFHQTIFNDDRICVAFPAKGGQAHGRTLGHAVLPVQYEENQIADVI